jgi:putative transposase
MPTTRHRKKVKHFHEPGDLHELTFSCYRRMPLLTNDDWRYRLARSLDAAVVQWQFQLVAFVFMPEHVHLLVNPLLPERNLPMLLSDTKRPYSGEIRQLLEASGVPLLKRLMIRERPGKTVFRYWQEGPGFDRNLQSVKAILASINYIHNNPVQRKLCKRAIDWKWSSARRFLLPEAPSDPDLPHIHGLPAEFWNGLNGKWTDAVK